MKPKISQTLFVLMLCVLMTACANTRRVLNFDTSASLRVVAVADVNPDTDGRASPIVVKVFQLKNRQVFDAADFMSLYNDPDAVLSGSLLSRTKLREFTPDSIRDEAILLETGVNYVGILAEYVQFDVAQTKLVFPVHEHQSNEYEVILQQLSVVDGESVRR